MAIDRRNGAEVAMETVKLAEEFMLSSDGPVVGIDLSGDPTVSQPVFSYFNAANLILMDCHLIRSEMISCIFTI